MCAYSREVTKEQGQKVAQEWGVPFIECSAKKNENISLVFTTLIHEIEKNSGQFYILNGFRHQNNKNDALMKRKETYLLYDRKSNTD